MDKERMTSVDELDGYLMISDSQELVHVPRSSVCSFLGRTPTISSEQWNEAFLESEHVCLDAELLKKVATPFKLPMVALRTRVKGELLFATQLEVENSAGGRAGGRFLFLHNSYVQVDCFLRFVRKTGDTTIAPWNHSEGGLSEQRPSPFHVANAVAADAAVLGPAERLFLLDVLPSIGPVAPRESSDPLLVFERRTHKFKKENVNSRNQPIRLVPPTLLEQKRRVAKQRVSVASIGSDDGHFPLLELPEEVVDLVLQHAFCDCVKRGDDAACRALFRTSATIQSRCVRAWRMAMHSIATRVAHFVDHATFGAGASPELSYALLGVPPSWLFDAESAVELLERKCKSPLHPRIADARGRSKSHTVAMPSSWLRKIKKPLRLC